MLKLEKKLELLAIDLTFTCWGSDANIGNIFLKNLDPQFWKFTKEINFILAQSIPPLFPINYPTSHQLTIIVSSQQGKQMLYFYSPWKYQKSPGFLTFLRYIEMEYGCNMG